MIALVFYPPQATQAGSLRYKLKTQQFSDSPLYYPGVLRTYTGRPLTEQLIESRSPNVYIQRLNPEMPSWI